ncbi:short-subunit dehydrogenase [Sphingomonas zeicaulis]|uniref:SDR family oxidoreductase n=1 Tax=Sphingomonas zeicaulis TaxID=1632740 RepID=UPI003D1BC2A3
MTIGGKSKASAARTVVISGASSGIGQATAEGFATTGASLVLAARDEDALNIVAQRCRDLGARVLVVPTEVGDADAVHALAIAARDFGDGRIDFWFSNVGIGAVGKFVEVPIDAHERVIRSNLIGHMNDAHAVLPVFIAQGRGTFVNMISLVGFSGAPFAAAYSASKFGLRGFSEALRGEMADHPDIHICDVYPSFVDTPAIGHAGNYTGKRLTAPPPILDPRRVAAAVVSLADHPRDTVILGTPTWAARVAHLVSPTLTARMVSGMFGRYFASADPAPVSSGNLFSPPGDGGRAEGGLRAPRPVRQRRAAAAIGSIAAVVIAATLIAQRRLSPKM